MPDPTDRAALVEALRAWHGLKGDPRLAQAADLLAADAAEIARLREARRLPNGVVWIVANVALLEQMADGWSAPVRVRVEQLGTEEAHLAFTAYRPAPAELPGQIDCAAIETALRGDIAALTIERDQLEKDVRSAEETLDHAAREIDALTTRTHRAESGVETLTAERDRLREAVREVLAVTAALDAQTGRHAGYWIERERFDKIRAALSPPP